MVNRNRSQRLFFLIILILILLIGFISGKISERRNIKSFFIQNGHKYNPLGTVLKLIDNEYVDSVNTIDIQNKAISALLSELDPHSVFITSKEFNDINDPLTGNFDGIGIQFRMEKDTVYIVNTIQGGPSEKVGILAGDRIIKINDSIIAGKNLTANQVTRLLKGPKRTKVNIDIYRNNVKNLINYTITRAAIPTFSVDIAFMPEAKIGYLKLSKFSATSSKEVTQAIKQLQLQGMENLIFDLRGNAGGYLEAAIEIADKFLEDNKLIVYTEGYHRTRKYAYSELKGPFEKGNLILLIDEGSASSSEIVAGAIQDNDRGLLIGRRSFGKGLVQEQVPLPDGSAVRLTIARYYTPSGRCIQKHYEPGHNKEYEFEVYDRMIDTNNVENINDTTIYLTQKGRKVYGGGGIIPDIIVPIEKNKNYYYFNKLLNAGVIHQFAFEYVDANRQNLKIYKNANQYINKFFVTDKMLLKIIKLSEDKGVKFDNIAYNFVKEDIKNLVKALIARDIYGDDGYFPIVLSSDNVFKMAIEKIKNSSAFAGNFIN